MSPLPTSIFFHISPHLLPLPAIQFAQSNIPATNKNSLPACKRTALSEGSKAPEKKVPHIAFKRRLRRFNKTGLKSAVNFFFYCRQRKKNGAAASSFFFFMCLQLKLPQSFQRKNLCCCYLRRLRSRYLEALLHRHYWRKQSLCSP